MARAAAWILFLLAPLPGQSPLVLPPGHDLVEGSSATAFPFGRSDPFRLQEIYWRQCFPAPAREMRITALAFRADGGVKNLAKPFVRLEIYLSTTPRDYGRASNTFAENRGADWTRVFAAQVHLPTSPGTSPNPFDIRFALDAPFTYATESAGLLVELVVIEQPAGRYYLDSPFRCTSTQGGFGQSANSCTTSLGSPLALASNESVKIGGDLVLTLTLAPPEALVGAWVGVRTTGKYGALNLPADLGPYGAPRCSLLLEPLWGAATKANKQGLAAFSLRLPHVYELLGQRLYAQAFAADLGANQLGLVLSVGHQVTVCGPHPVGRIFASGDLKAPTGLVQFGSAHILRLTRH